MGLLKSKPVWNDQVVNDVWACAAGVMTKLPIIWEYLCAAQYEDGTKRVPATLSVFVEDRVVKVALNDRDAERSLYLSGETLEEALKALEKHLGHDKPDWRRWAKKKK